MKQVEYAWLAVAMLTIACPIAAGAASMAAGTGATMTGTPATGANISSGASVNTATGAKAGTGFNGTWSAQDHYWRNNYSTRPYYNTSRDYTVYQPAYKYGVELYNQNQGKSFDQLDQSQLNRGWTTARGNSSLNWSDAQTATRDAYNRMYENRSAATASSTAR